MRFLPSLLLLLPPLLAHGTDVVTVEVDATGATHYGEHQGAVGEQVASAAAAGSAPEANEAAGHLDALHRVAGADAGLDDLDDQLAAYREEVARQLAKSMWDALHARSEESVVGLVEAGFDLSTVLNENLGHVALDVACLVGDPSMVSLLLGRGADPLRGDTAGYKPLQNAAYRGDAGVVRRLLKEPKVLGGGYHKEVHRDGQTPAIRAAWGSSPQGDYVGVLEALLGAGVDVDELNGDRQTVLQVATLSSNPDLVKLLLARGADVAHRDAHGNTALHLALRSAGKPVVRLLLEGGADPAAEDRKGRTALALAKETGRVSVEMLEPFVKAREER
jgi:ankyrin repeat protein